MILEQLHSVRRRSERDVQLVRQGDPASPLLTILSGWAFRYSMLSNGRRQILSLHLPGDTVGLDTLLTGAPTYPVQSAGAVTYCYIEHERAAAVAQDAPWFRRRALEALAADRATAEAALTRLGQCNAEERVASLFLELYDRLLERGLAANGSFKLELTQQHLADLVGLTAVHLNRVLQRLKGRKLLAMSGHQVTLPDAQSLEFLAIAPYPAMVRAARPPVTAVSGHAL
ncbi:MAG: Crp/Fnr family transcriptional regulator [Acetobacteraceae bacterium]